jgi:hypothetical protein
MNNQRAYRHTQIGWMTIGIVGCVAVFGTAALLSAGIGAVPVMIFASLTLVVPLLFGSMTVTLDETHVALSFGIGLIRKRFSLDEIRSYQPVRNPWYYGWGIKMIPGGWLYNVSGPSAVELLLESGRYVRIGTDEPGALVAALRAAIGESSSLGESKEQPRRLGIIPKIVSGSSAVIAAGVFTMMYFESQPPTVTASPEKFSVSSGMYSEEVPMREVVSVSLERALPRVLLRTNGFAMGGRLRGHFRLDQLGSGQLFVEWGAPPYIVVRTRRDFVIVNFKEPERTRELYDVLTRYHDKQ